MRIICVGRDLGLGGLERQLVGLAEMLDAEGHDVTLLTYSTTRSGFYLFTGNVKHDLVPKRLLTAPFLLRLKSYLQEHKPDAVIAFGMSPSRKVAIAHILWPHFKLITSERNAKPSVNITDFYRILLFRIGADVVVCNNFAQQKILGKHFPWIMSKVRVIPNYVDTSLFCPRPDAQRQRPFRIVTTARISPRKNIIRYIRAVRKAIDMGADIRVEWYGRQNDSAYCRRCLAEIRKSSLGDRFFLMDARTDVEEIYRGAHAFCLPSLYEGTSNSLAEAMACGLPVICTMAGDNSIYVQDGIGGYFCNPRSVDSMAEALLRISNASEAVIDEMRTANRQTAMDEFEKSKFVKDYCGILKQA